MSEHKSALVIGASRGLGLAIAQELLKRGWRVTGTVRGEQKTRLHELLGQYAGRLEIEYVDITYTDEIAGLKHRLSGNRYDVLFVNAGISPGPMPIGEVPTDEFVRTMVTNSLSPMRIVESLTEQVRKGGVVGVMSSGQGSIADNEGRGVEVYRASKAALNMLMKSFAARRGQDRALLLLAPGWIKTDMGGEDARFTIEETIGDIVDTIIGQEGKTGLRYLDRFGRPVRW